jgi:hypothetical protein
MYRRTNTLLAIVAFLAMFLIVPALTYADQAGLGGAYVDGHSDSGEYGINNKGPQSWGLHFNYDKDLGWKKKLGKHAAIGLDPSMQLFYLHWTKTVNGEETYCDGRLYEYEEYGSYCMPERGSETWSQEKEAWKTRDTYSNHSVDSLIAGVGPKAYLELGKFRLYGLAGIGYALQDGAHDDVAGIIQGGISYQFTKSFGISADHSEIYVSPLGEYDRFDVTSLNAVLFF